MLLFKVVPKFDRCGSRFMFIRSILAAVVCVMLLQIGGNFLTESTVHDPGTGFDRQLKDVVLGVVCATLFVFVSGFVAPKRKMAARMFAIAIVFVGISFFMWASLNDPHALKDRDLSTYYSAILAMWGCGILVVFIGTIVMLGRFLTWRRVLLVIIGIVGFGFAEFTRAQRAYGKGLFGQQISDIPGICTVFPATKPWMEMAPRRIFNFWMGSMECPEPPAEPFAQVDAVGQITFHGPCGSARGDPLRPEVVFDPDWVTWREQEQADELEWVRQKHSPTRVIAWEGKPIQMPPADEFALATCDGKSLMLMRNRRKEDVHARAMEELTKHRESLKESASFFPVTSMMLLIDCLSRAHFHRRFPLVREWLERMANPDDPKSPYELHEFFRYNVFGGNTYPTLTPMIAGTIVNRISDAADISPMFYWRYPYDGLGYARAYGNNLCQDYFGYYWKAWNSSMDHQIDFPFCHPDYEPKKRSNFVGPYSIGSRCIDGSPVHEMLLSYLKEFMDNYNDVGRLAFFSFMEAHEGSMEVVAVLDKPFRDFLEWMHQKNYLGNTIMLLASDHGNHMSVYERFSLAGKIERKLPLLMVLVPKAMTSKYPQMSKNLRANTQKLVSSLDIFKTLKHIATYPEAVPPTRNEAPAGISLFEEIPNKRSCQDASIPWDHCICFYEDEAQRNSLLPHV